MILRGGGRIAYLWNKIKEYVTGKLADYYTKSETYSSTEVGDIFGKYKNTGEISVKGTISLSESDIELVTSDSYLGVVTSHANYFNFDRPSGFVVCNNTYPVHIFPGRCLAV